MNLENINKPREDMFIDENKKIKKSSTSTSKNVKNNNRDKINITGYYDNTNATTNHRTINNNENCTFENENITGSISTSSSTNSLKANDVIIRNSSNSLQESLSSRSISSSNSLVSENSNDISPLLAHYHGYSGEDLHLHISIAQGGLQRIRREAQSAKVSLKDIVLMFGTSIENMSKNGDRETQRSHLSEKSIFKGTVIPKISTGAYLWRIIRALNAHSEPALFASDGSDLAHLCSLNSLGSNECLASVSKSSQTQNDRTADVLEKHTSTIEEEKKDSDNFATSGSNADTTTCDSSMGSNKQRENTDTKKENLHILEPASNNNNNNSNNNHDIAAENPSKLLFEGENSAMGRGLRCLLLAFVYIDRACTRCPSFVITSFSVHRILLTAIYMASKYSDDTLSRAHWTFANLGGVSCRELKMLEREFCKLVDFRFYVTEAEFQAHCMEQLRCAVRSVRHLKELEGKIPKDNFSN